MKTAHFRQGRRKWIKGGLMAKGKAREYLVG
jgi:hypothetical protein